MISLALCEDSKFKIQNCIDTTLNLEPEMDLTQKLLQVSKW